MTKHLADRPGARAARSRRRPRGGPAPRVALASLPHAHERADAENVARVRANTRRVKLLTAGAAAVPAVVLGVVVGIVVGTVAGAGAAVAACVVAVLFVHVRALPIALRLVGAVPVADGALPALANQVEGLCATIGVSPPELWLVDDPVANSCALAGPGPREVLVVTSGLLERMGLIEMEGVVAHELVHLKRRDAAVSSVALASVGLVSWLTGRDALVHRAVGRGREYGADQAAALAVRYPPGLHAALASMGGPAGEPAGEPAGGQRGQRGRASAFAGRRWAATRWIWIDPMVGDREAAPDGELDATRARMDALAQW